MKRTVIPSILVGVALLSTVLFTVIGCANREENPVTSAAKNSPEKAVEQLVAAVKSEDVQAVVAQLGGRSRAMRDFEFAAVEFHEALSEKFGRENAGDAPPSFKDELDHIVRKTETVRIRKKRAIDDKTVAITIWRIRNDDGGDAEIGEETWHAVLEAGKWRIVLPPKGKEFRTIRKDDRGEDVAVSVLKTRDYSSNRELKLVQHYKKQVRRLEECTADVLKGKYASAEAAWNAARISDPEFH